VPCARSDTARRNKWDSFTSVAEREPAIDPLITDRNARPRPFFRTADADDFLAEVQLDRAALHRLLVALAMDRPNLSRPEHAVQVRQRDLARPREDGSEDRASDSRALDFIQSAIELNLVNSSYVALLSVLRNIEASKPQQQPTMLRRHCAR
jgi:hypothetical protein